MESSLPDMTKDIASIRGGSRASAEYPGQHMGRPDVSSNLLQW